MVKSSAIMPNIKKSTMPETTLRCAALEPKLATEIRTAPSATSGAIYAVTPKKPNNIPLTALPNSPQIPKLHKKRKIVKATIAITTSSLLKE